MRYRRNSAHETAPHTPGAAVWARFGYWATATSAAAIPTAVYSLPVTRVSRGGADILAIMKANALLGVGVPGITNPGYGNLTLLGACAGDQALQC